MEIKEYFSTKYQAHWLEEIRQSDWSAGQFLYELLSKNEIHEFCGNYVRLFLLTEGKKLVSFCTLSDIDDIKNTDLGPWIGFVYTFPQYRGHRYMGLLLDHACRTAKEDGAGEVFTATGETGLYETYGYSFYQMMENAVGVMSRVYRKDLS